MMTDPVADMLTRIRNAGRAGHTETTSPFSRMKLSIGKVLKEYKEIPSVPVNHGRMGQVFLNIILNAAQSIEEGHVEENWIRVRTGEENGEVFAEIRNSGAPIPADVLPRLFDPFFTTKPLGQGTGLGLSIAYSTVQQHGGRIEVESDAEQGTAFRVWLPLGAQAAEPAVAAQPRPATGRRAGSPIKGWEFGASEKPRHDGFTELRYPPAAKRLPTPRAAFQKGRIDETQPAPANNPAKSLASQGRLLLRGRTR